jgi:hypothetical protein
VKHHHTTEAQGYNSLGELAPEAEQVLTHQKGWDGIAGDPPTAEQPIAQLQAHDASFWNRRANRQTLAVTDDSSYAEDFFNPVNHPADIPPVAGYAQGQGYTQVPAAATNPTSFARSAELSSEDGISPDPRGNPASAAAERSGNTGAM